MGMKVAVVRGGKSREAPLSLATGAALLSALNDQGITIIDVVVNERGVWHAWGRPVAPADVVHQADVVVNAMHGEYGEDGTLQRMLELFSVPYTGSGVLGAAASLNKDLTKSIARSLGFKSPRSKVVEPTEGWEGVAKKIFNTFMQPLIVKPRSSGSSIGVRLSVGYHDLLRTLHEFALIDDVAIVEEYIPGDELTVGVIEGFRNESLYKLEPIHITKKGPVYTYREKYLDIAPQQVYLGGHRDTLMSQAALIHEALNLRHYSRSDFILSPRGVYFLEVNALPYLGHGAPFVMSLEAVGSSLPQFSRHLVDLARGERYGIR